MAGDREVRAIAGAFKEVVRKADVRGAGANLVPAGDVREQKPVDST
jgi:hypothetical protein